MLNLLHSSMKQEQFKKHLSNQSSHYEKYEWCRMPQLMVLHPSIIVSVKSEVFIMLWHQLGSTRCYTQ